MSARDTAGGTAGLCFAAAGLVFFAGVLMAVGTMDYQDATALYEHCQSMIKAGHWPQGACQ